MVSSRTTLLVAVLALASTQVRGFQTFLAKIPNGEAMGQELGHAGKDYTPFGTLFKNKGATWGGVCKEMWPGASVTVGAVLGDPCCKWTSGKPDFELSSPFLQGKTCGGGATPTPSGGGNEPGKVRPGGDTSQAPSAKPGPATPTPSNSTPAPGGGGKPGPSTPAPGPTPAPGGGGGKPAPTPAPSTGKPAPTPAPSTGKPSPGKPSNNGTIPRPTPAVTKPSGKPHKLCK